jgi:hypothetical protein
MDKPRPLPPECRARDCSSRLKRLNISGKNWGDTPGPSSEFEDVMPAGVMQRHLKVAAIASVT